MASERVTRELEEKVASVHPGTPVDAPSSEDESTPKLRTKPATINGLVCGQIDGQSSVHDPSICQIAGCPSIFGSQLLSSADSALSLASPNGGVVPMSEGSQKSLSRAISEAFTRFFRLDVSGFDHRLESTAFTDGAEGRLYGDTLSPIPFSSSPMAITRPESQISTGSLDAELGWNTAELLKVSESVRASTASVIPEEDLERLEQILEAMTNQEFTTLAVDIDIIRESQFDKLLLNLLTIDKKHFLGDDKLADMAERFKETLFSIDDERLKKLTTEGALRDIVPFLGARTIPYIWKVQKTTPLMENSLKPGMWWINVYCLMRDGIVNSIREVITKRQGFLHLPMLTGTEVEGPTVDRYLYQKEGSIDEMLLDLMRPCGQIVRVFRGHKLKSKWAPSAGIRYDGEYQLDQYGHHYNPHTKKFIVKLVLDRLPVQKSVNALRHIPVPSQLDDWLLYKKAMGDEIRSREGDEDYIQWKDGEKQQEDDRKEWLASRTLM